MWIFTRNGFISLAERPQEGNKLIIQTQTREEMEQVVHCSTMTAASTRLSRRWMVSVASTAATKDVAAQVIARLVAGIDYCRFTQAVNFDFGNDPQFLLWMNPRAFKLLG